MRERLKDPIRLGMQARISTQREIIAGINQQLQELNEHFPGQRFLSRDKQDPDYRTQRENLLIKKWGNAHVIQTERRALRSRLESV